MSRIAKRLTDLIGSTPLLEIDSFTIQHQALTTKIAKREHINPGGCAVVI